MLFTAACSRLAGLLARSAFALSVLAAATGTVQTSALASALGNGRSAAPAAPAYMPIGEDTNAPLGYRQFCDNEPADCQAGAQEARDVVLSTAAWQTLVSVNAAVNAAVEPVTDQDHYGRAEWWAYPVDGRGDCEDYVLEKRRELIAAGWPRSALLITVVRDRKGDGHAVLDVKTDRGEFILDNQADDVLPWQATGYRYVKRQSQADQTVWVSLGDRQPTPLVAAQ